MPMNNMYAKFDVNLIMVIRKCAENNSANDEWTYGRNNFNHISFHSNISYYIPSCSVPHTYEWVMLVFVVLLSLVPCSLASVCAMNDSCRYPDTKPLGVPVTDITKRDIYPMSCALACMVADDCVGVTLDAQEEICHLYDGSAPFELTQDTGTTLWLFQAAGVPCVKVGWIAIPGNWPTFYEMRLGDHAFCCLGQYHCKLHTNFLGGAFLIT